MPNYTPLRGILVQLLLVCGAAAPALAHPFHSHPEGLAASLLHPLSGVDHLLAMLAVGMIAARFSGRRRFVIPVVFTVFVALGWALGGAVAAGVIEHGISLSLLVFAAALLSPGAGYLAALSVAFGLFHGFAHRLEAAGGGISALGGLLAGTLLITVLGLLATERLSLQARKVACGAAGAALLLSLVGA